VAKFTVNRPRPVLVTLLTFPLPLGFIVNGFVPVVDPSKFTQALAMYKGAEPDGADMVADENLTSPVCI
jgi:hypothetical protein